MVEPNKHPLASLQTKMVLKLIQCYHSLAFFIELFDERATEYYTVWSSSLRRRRCRHEDDFLKEIDSGGKRCLDFNLFVCSYLIIG